MTAIDPAVVPAFPVYTLVLSGDRGIISLDGTPVPIDPDTSLVDAGRVAVQARLQSHGLDAVRVRAIDEDSGERWNMIIAADGDLLDLTEQEREAEETATRQRKRRKMLLTAAAGAAILAGISGAVVAFWPTAAPAPAAYQPKGMDATLPAAPPPVFATLSTWSQPVATGSTAKLLADGTLLTTSTKGYLEILDAQTGQVTWRGEAAPSDVATVHEMTFAGRQVLAAVSSSALTVWPREMPDGAAAVAPRTYKISTGQSGRVDGQEPLVDLGDWYVKIPDKQNMKSVMIPPGSAVVEVTPEAITTISADTVYTVAHDGTVTAEMPFTPPAEVTGYPSSILALDENHVLLGWEGQRSTSVMDLRTLQTVVTAEVRQAPSKQRTVLTDPAGSTTVAGLIAVQHGEEPSITELPRGFTATAVHGTTVFGTTNDGPATVDLTHEDPEPELWASYTDDDPAPWAVTDEAAYIIATQLDASTIYRVDRN